MATPALIDAIDSLRTPGRPHTKISALRLLKNEVVGHNERKEVLLRNGIVDALSLTLNHFTPHSNPRLNGNHEDQLTWSENDEVRLQAIFLLGSLAHGGLAFLAPIQAGNIVPTLLRLLSAADNPPRLLLAALRILSTLTNVISHDPVSHLHQASQLRAVIFTPHTCQSFAAILANKSLNSVVRKQHLIIYRIIGKSWATDAQKNILLAHGILDHLAAQLSDCILMLRRCTLPATSVYRLSFDTLPLLLAAISSLVQDSKFRVARLLHSPSLLPTLPFTTVEHLPPDNAPYNTSISAALPWLYPGQSKVESGFSRAFPLLGTPQARASALLDPPEDSPWSHANSPNSSPPESLLVPWLMVIMRAERGLCLVEAARLLTILARAGFVTKLRERQLALIVVPPLVTALDEAIQNKKSFIDLAEHDLECHEQLPRVLADLIKDSPALQRAAWDASIVKKISALLKQTFEPVSGTTPLWSADSKEGNREDSPSASSQIGQSGFPMTVTHAMKSRESALLLLAAITTKEDRYRKPFTENGTVGIIVDCLTPMKESSIAQMHMHGWTEKLDSSIGNTIPVILAACQALLSLSRSAYQLRTNIVDAGAAKPLVPLLKHQCVDVVYSAAEVVCNLLLEFSVSRASLIDGGIIKVLCDHAHSADTRIRLLSLHALKHLVNNAPLDIKNSCYEGIGTGWLVQIISGGSINNTADSQPSSSFKSSIGPTSNSAGERVDILNAIDEPMDTSESNDTQSQDTPDRLPDYETSLEFFQADSRNQLTAIKASEDLETSQQHYRNEIEVQVHALGFLRNLIMGQDGEAMIDLVFETIGASRIFDMVYTKLQLATTSDARPTHQPASVLESCIYVLVHVAAGAPKHRAQLISQTALLRVLQPLAGHAEYKIRIAVIWCIANLTWRDDSADEAAKRRAADLEALGWYEVMQRLCKDDSMDARERAVNVCSNFDQLRVAGEQGFAGPGHARHVSR